MPLPRLHLVTDDTVLRDERFAKDRLRVFSREELAKQALIPVGSSPDEFAAFLRREVSRYRSIADKIGLQPQ